MSRNINKGSWLESSVRSLNDPNLPVLQDLLRYVAVPANHIFTIGFPINMGEIQGHKFNGRNKFLVSAQQLQSEDGALAVRNGPCWIVWLWIWCSKYEAHCKWMFDGRCFRKGFLSLELDSNINFKCVRFGSVTKYHGLFCNLGIDARILCIRVYTKSHNQVNDWLSTKYQEPLNQFQWKLAHYFQY